MEAVARDFFDSKVTMEVLNQSEEDERTGKKEHVVFLVKQTNRASKTRDQCHSCHRGVGVCAWSVSMCIYYVCFWLLAHLCSVWFFSQEALFRTMRDRCVSLAGKKNGWDLIRAVVLSEKGLLCLYLEFMIWNTCAYWSYLASFLVHRSIVSINSFTLQFFFL